MIHSENKTKLMSFVASVKKSFKILMMITQRKSGYFANVSITRNACYK